MLVRRRSLELSGHQNLKAIKKVTTSDRSVAQWRDLLFLFQFSRKLFRPWGIDFLELDRQKSLPQGLKADVGLEDGRPG